jgi:hypothetical protein
MIFTSYFRLLRDPIVGFGLSHMQYKLANVIEEIFDVIVGGSHELPILTNVDFGHKLHF